MRHHAFTAVALGALMAASGCTVKIPPESIQVSRIVQSNLEDLQDKHVELVNAYFALRAEKFDEWFLVLLCHKHALPPLAPQVGQKGSLATRARALRIRCVVIEVGLCLCPRRGGAPRAEAFG